MLCVTLQEGARQGRGSTHRSLFFFSRHDGLGVTVGSQLPRPRPPSLVKKLRALFAKLVVRIVCMKKVELETMPILVPASPI